MDTNVLYYGDNLEILRKYIPDSSVDLIYLDPPFNSNATYNVLFKEPSGKPSEAQISAFEDTWQWGRRRRTRLDEMARSPLVPNETKQFISVLPTFVGARTAMRAYLTMMAIRLVELRRVLKDTGSIYLHCDPTASHYLKLLMDTIFGTAGFRNEIVWRRTTAAQRSEALRPRSTDSHPVLLKVGRLRLSTACARLLLAGAPHDPGTSMKTAGTLSCREPDCSLTSPPTASAQVATG